MARGANSALGAGVQGAISASPAVVLAVEGGCVP